MTPSMQNAIFEIDKRVKSLGVDREKLVYLANTIPDILINIEQRWGTGLTFPDNGTARFGSLSSNEHCTDFSIDRSDSDFILRVFEKDSANGGRYPVPVYGLFPVPNGMNFSLRLGSICGTCDENRYRHSALDAYGLTVEKLKSTLSTYFLQPELITRICTEFESCLCEHHVERQRVETMEKELEQLRSKLTEEALE